MTVKVKFPSKFSPLFNADVIPQLSEQETQEQKLGDVERPLFMQRTFSVSLIRPPEDIGLSHLGIIT